MPNLLLINPPIARYDVSELAPPLGLLVLASQARAVGYDCRILDLNLPAYRSLGDDPETYYDQALENEAVEWADEVGITAMGVNSHVALTLGEQIRQRFGTPVTVGGPHLSSISGLVGSLFPALTVATPAFRLAAKATDWRRLESSFVDPEVLYSGFDLSPYFAANRRRVANVEAGRGCRYRCAFCYSPAAYPRWSNADVWEFVRGMKALEELGFRHAFVVNDNLTNDFNWFAGLLDSLASNSVMKWNGYATVRDLDLEIFSKLAAAGCGNIYVGVDAATPRLRRLWGKNFFRHDEQVIDLVSAASAAGVDITAALILLGGSDSSDDVAALDLALRLRRAGAQIRLSLLTAYPGTRISQGEVAYSEAKASVLMDLPLVVVENPLAQQFPSSFPWHAAAVRQSDWERIVLAVHGVQTAFLASEDALPESGRDLWRTAMEAAKRVQLLPTLHKVELRGTLERQLRALFEVW